jgi:hypothetical protein
MAEELITFPKTEEVLKRMAEDVKAGYIDQLNVNKHPTSYGQNRLSDTITTIVSVDGQKFSASLKMNYYWKFLEEGTKPHWPPSDAIAKWIEVKPVIPRPDGNGRIPTPKQLAFLIGRAMAGQSPNQANLKNPQGGTKGTHGFQKTRDAIVPLYVEELERAFNEDIGFYIMRVFKMNPTY